MTATARTAVLTALGLMGALIVLWAATNGGQGSARAQTAAATTTRTYYIAADEVDWNYAPAGRNVITGRPFNDDENVFVEQGPDRIGSTYKKALYRQYTDASFTRLQPKDARWEHTGMLGPVIRAEVGDTIKVVFRNNATQPSASTRTACATPRTRRARRTTTAPQGPTRRTTPSLPARRTPTTGTSRRGPARPRMDGQSVMWMYHSHTDEIADTNAGLIGPMVITRTAPLRADGERRRRRPRVLLLLHGR